MFIVYLKNVHRVLKIFQHVHKFFQHVCMFIVYFKDSTLFENKINVYNLNNIQRVFGKTFNMYF